MDYWKWIHNFEWHDTLLDIENKILTLIFLKFWKLIGFLFIFIYCFTTTEVIFLPFSTTTCSDQYVYFMTMVSPSKAVDVVWGTMQIIKFPYLVSCRFFQICIIDRHGIFTPHLALGEIMSNFFVSIMEICDKLVQVNSTIVVIGRPRAPLSIPLKHSEILVVIAP